MVSYGFSHENLFRLGSLHPAGVQGTTSLHLLLGLGALPDGLRMFTLTYIVHLIVQVSKSKTKEPSEVGFFSYL